MTHKVSVSRRWIDPIPIGKEGKPLDKRLWPQRRKHVWTVRWFALDSTGKKKRPSRSFKTRAEAEDFRAEKQAEFIRSPQARAEARQLTMGQFVDEFAEQQIGASGKRLRAGSMDIALRTLRRFANFIGPGRKLSTIRAIDANRFFNGLTEDRDKVLTPHTVAKIKRTLKAAFSAAVYLDLLQENPLSKLRVGTLEDTPIRYVTPGEFLTILAVCDAFPLGQSLWWRALLTTFYTAGLRFGEAAHLTWADVDFGNDTIRVSAKKATAQTLVWLPKTNSSIRTIPVPPETLALLAELQATSPDGHAYVFTPAARIAAIRAAQEVGLYPKGSQLLRGAQVRFPDIVRKAAESTPSLVNSEGKSTASFHDLRRTCITNWSTTITMQTVMVLAGHTTITTTAKYYAAATDEQFELARQASRAALKRSESRQTDPKVTPRDGLAEEVGSMIIRQLKVDQ